MHRKEENITENRTTLKTVPNIQSMRKLNLFKNIILWADKNEGIETSRLRNLKIIRRKLNEIVLS
jgi:hypothetical protein